MRATSTARRVIPLRDAIPRSAKPRAKKPAPSFPTAAQLEEVTSRLRTLVSTGEAQKADGELERLLIALGIDPTHHNAWRDGFLLLAALHCGVGKPRRTNKNAIKLSSADNMILLREMVQLMGQGLNEAQAVERLATDPSKAEMFRFKPTSSIAQRRETLRWRLRGIKKTSSWLENIFGTPCLSTVEEALINLALAEVGRNQRAL
jgi:hypothetical protein